ncbi:glycosyltransferase family 4 protein [Cohnella sp. GCM10012308]|uniref:glycosyltransferase family 4 protein n=1 Tax=Cohnella sp. GCM10012308 TaxID=3317329 RepID=UPI00361EBE2C
MNILFLTLLDFDSLEERGIYTDLLREFVKDNHKVYIVSPTERRKKQPTRLIENGNCRILKLQIGNIQKTNIIEKGISTFFLESQFQRGVRKYFFNIKFNLVIYSTPPITLQKAIKDVKKRNNAKTYLLLKDIFPQNAVDLGMMRKNGIQGVLYKYFRAKEDELYQISDFIGCMSQANVDYILNHNKGLSRDIVEICPNTLEPRRMLYKDQKNEIIKKKYNIPINKTVFIYGGNLGKPQGIDFLIKCVDANKNNKQVHFVIVGAGTEFNKIKAYFDKEQPPNAQLFRQMSKYEYEVLEGLCDVGLIFLDRRFTIPNFPSRILSYMQASIPVLAATDCNTDVGKVIESGEFGFWCESGNVKEFNHRMDLLCDAELRERMGSKAREYLEEYYTARHSYEIIMKHFKKNV